MPSVLWYPWSVQQLISQLPSSLSLIEDAIDRKTPPQIEEVRSNIDLFRQGPVTEFAIKSERLTRALLFLANTANQIGQSCADKGAEEDALILLQTAHEFGRVANPSQTPNASMRMALQTAIGIQTRLSMLEIRAGTVEAGQALASLNDFVASAWGTVPSQLALSMNERVLVELEHLRADLESDSMTHDRLVRDNIEAVLSMEIPTRLLPTRAKWESIGDHVAPAAVRITRLSVRRPESLSKLLSDAEWASLKGYVEAGDAQGLLALLQSTEDKLATNLSLRLDAKPEYRQPYATFRYKGSPDRFFEEAHALLLRNDTAALDRFRDLHFQRPANTIIKEWHAYALARFGGKGDVWEIIDILKEAIESDLFREDTGWTARWNLACALAAIPSRVPEALDVLLPVLDRDEHPSEVFDLCLAWALNQQRDEVLEDLLVKSPWREAHLLAALRGFESQSTDNVATFQDHFRRINRVVRDPDKLFPDPKEFLRPLELTAITRDFIDSSLVDAGIEWFRQRVSYGNERNNYKNWECAASLNERAQKLDAAWYCRTRQWDCSRKSKKITLAIKSSSLSALLIWAQHNGFQERAKAILKRDGADAGLKSADILIWERRLTTTVNSPVANSFRGPQSGRTDPDLHEAKPLTPSADEAIQSTAGEFNNIYNAGALADKRDKGDRLLSAVMGKYPNLEGAIIAPLRQVLACAVRITAGVSDVEISEIAGALNKALTELKKTPELIPYELQGLSQACIRVAEGTIVRSKTVPELRITPPTDLAHSLDPTGGHPYSTRLFARISNPTNDSAFNVQVAFICVTTGILIPDNTAHIQVIGPFGKEIAECPLSIDILTSESLDIRIMVTYTIGNLTKTVQSSCSIPVVPLGKAIPLALRYVTSAPVGLDRPDLFHGRDRELDDLLVAFSGGRLRKLYFVNGIRRVGKSTLIRHLGVRCGSTTLPVLLDLERTLSGAHMNSAQLVRALLREAYSQIRRIPQAANLDLVPPSVQEFELDSPWTIFEEALTRVRDQLRYSNLLICFDEVQYLIKLIASSNGIDDGLLSWLRAKAQEQSDVLIICTGSEPYAVMRKRHERHTLWGNMEPYSISFIERSEMERVATMPVKPDGVTWLPEALGTLWDMTEGHPWITQLLAEECARQLNLERRRIVTPGDVLRAAQTIAIDPRVGELWWNERDELLTPAHRQVAYLLLDQQPNPHEGIIEAALVEACKRKGLRHVGKLLEEMRQFEVMAESRDQSETRWRIKGVFLEAYLESEKRRASYESAASNAQRATQDPVALVADIENAKIRLHEYLKSRSEAEEKLLAPQLQGEALGTSLLQIAARYGVPSQRWAVADWDRAFFQGDQKAYRQVRYWTDMATSEKTNSSDHVLVERVHNLLRDHSEIKTFVIVTGDGDYNELIGTLKKENKSVVLCATREAMNRVYGSFLRGADEITIEWLEDAIFGNQTISQ